MKIKEINISDNEVLEVFENMLQVKNSVLGWLDSYKEICSDIEDFDSIEYLNEYENELLNIDNDKLNINDINDNIEFLIFKKYELEV